jgi:hypothetical protein
MSSESNNVIPLSQARLNRENNDMIEVSEDKLRNILTEVVDERLANKLTRLENSINRVVGQFESLASGEKEDAALKVTTELDDPDIALSKISLSKEEYYPYACAQLAEKLNVRSYDVIAMLKLFKLRDNHRYHICISTGKKGKVHKYSETTYKRLCEALDSGEYPKRD